MAGQPELEPAYATSDIADQLMESGVMDDIIDQEAPVDNVGRETEVEDAEVDDSAVQDAPDPEVDEESADADESDEVEVESADEEDTSSEELPEIESLDDLAQALETTSDEVQNNLKVQVKVDGELQTVTLKEALGAYQKDADYRQKTSELAETRRAFEAESQAKSEAIEQQHQIAAFVLQNAEQQLMNEANSAELENLRNLDPAEWGARQVELQNRIRQLNDLKMQAAQNWDMTQNQQREQQAQQVQEISAREREALSKAIPDLSPTLAGEISGYLQDSMGFKADEIKSALDHRLFVMANKARLYDAQQKSTDAAVKKVLKKPKRLLKPAPQTSPIKVGKNKLQQASARLKKTGRVEDAGRAIENLI